MSNKLSFLCEIRAFCEFLAQGLPFPFPGRAPAYYAQVHRAHPSLLRRRSVRSLASSAPAPSLPLATTGRRWLA
jgi:hypothetical protein